MGKKGQHWSIELMLALGVFAIVFVFLSVLTFYSPQSTEVSDLTFDSRIVFTSLERDVGLLRGNVVNSPVLRELQTMDPDELAAFFNIDGDVCITFQTLEGETIILDDGKYGIGLDSEGVCQ